MGSDPDAGRSRIAERARADGRTEETTSPRFFADPKRLVQTLVVVLLLVAAIYVLLPEARRDPGRVRRSSATPTRSGSRSRSPSTCSPSSPTWRCSGAWSASAVVHLEWRESYQITMAGLAATRLFSAGGAGGIVLTYWALRKAGMPRRQTACRMVAFLVLLYAVYMLALVVDGILLRTGVLAARAPPGLTIVPAAIAGARDRRLPADRADPRRLRAPARGGSRREPVRAARAAPGHACPATARERHARRRSTSSANPSRGGLAVLGAVGFWAANIGDPLGGFHAFDVHGPARRSWSRASSSAWSPT